MASLSVERKGSARTGSLLHACIAEHGSVAHPYFGSAALLTGPHAARNIADAVHFLCILHGRHPGVVDLAGGRAVESELRSWFIAAAEAMAVERVYLTRLAVAAGPAPSTPGGAESETAVNGVRGALATLAQSDRNGCALGAALAFVLDWSPVRSLLDAAARRFGVDNPPCRFSDEAELRAMADAAGEAIPTERALLFGAQQLALQHHGLWDLLDARQRARGDY